MDYSVIIICCIVIWAHVLVYIYFENIKKGIVTFYNKVFKRRNKPQTVIVIRQDKSVVGKANISYLEKVEEPAVLPKDEPPIEISYFSMNADVTDDSAEVQETENYEDLYKEEYFYISPEEMKELNDAPFYPSSNEYTTAATFEELNKLIDTLQSKEVEEEDIPQTLRTIYCLQDTDMFEFLVVQTHSEKFVSDLLEKYMKEVVSGAF